MRVEEQKKLKLTGFRWQAGIVFVVLLVLTLALPASAYELDKPEEGNTKEGCQDIQLNEKAAAQALQQANEKIMSYFAEQGEILDRKEAGKLNQELGKFISEEFVKLAVKVIREVGATTGCDTLNRDVENLAVNEVLADGYLLDYYLERSLELSGNLDDFFSILKGMGDFHQDFIADVGNKDALGDIWKEAPGTATEEPSTGGMLGNPSHYMSGNNNDLTLEDAARRTARNSAQIVRGFVQVLRGKPSGGRTILEAWEDQNDLYDEVLGYNQNDGGNDNIDNANGEDDNNGNENDSSNGDNNDDNGDNTDNDADEEETGDNINHGENNEEDGEEKEDSSRGGGCVLGECTCCHDAPNRFGIGDDPREDNEPDSGHETVSDDYDEEGPRNPFGVGEKNNDGFQFPEHYTGCDREEYPEATDRFGIVNKPEIQLDDPRVPLTNPTQPGLDW